MTPIEQVRPPTPGNWVRRPDSRVRRDSPAPDRKRREQKQDRDGRGSGPAPDGHEHIVDELA